ncbi:hypothetical protein H8E88_28345 [candidate division KSB1 bacterium]|nr:hypothetical protein [candidate division KSB1 bacterium]
MNIKKVKRPSKKILSKIQALKKEKGKIAVIEPDTGDYFLGETLIETLKKARKQYPGKLFYSIRIGSPFAHEHKGGIKQI